MHSTPFPGKTVRTENPNLLPFHAETITELGHPVLHRISLPTDNRRLSLQMLELETSTDHVPRPCLDSSSLRSETNNSFFWWACCAAIHFQTRNMAVNWKTNTHTWWRIAWNVQHVVAWVTKHAGIEEMLIHTLAQLLQHFEALNDRPGTYSISSSQIYT